MWGKVNAQRQCLRAITEGPWRDFLRVLRRKCHNENSAHSSPSHSQMKEKSGWIAFQAFPFLLSSSLSRFPLVLAPRIFLVNESRISEKVFFPLAIPKIEPLLNISQYFQLFRPNTAELAASCSPWHHQNRAHFICSFDVRFSFSLWCYVTRNKNKFSLTHTHTRIYRCSFVHIVQK